MIRLSLAGVEHVVAPLGTALTPDQAALLKRFAPAATILYDSDLPGLRATFRAGDELLRHAIRVRVATLPPGEDPDTLVRKGGVAALEAVLRDAIDLLERKIQMLERKGYFEGVEHRREALDRLLPTIRAAADPITRELYLSLAAERAGVSKEVLEQELAAGAESGASGAAGGRGARDRGSTGGATAPPTARAPQPETQLLAAMLAAPELDREGPGGCCAGRCLEKPRLREIFEALLQSDGAAGQLPEAPFGGCGGCLVLLEGGGRGPQQPGSRHPLRSGRADPASPTAVPRDGCADRAGRKAADACRSPERVSLRPMRGTNTRRRRGEKPASPSVLEEPECTPDLVKLIDLQAKDAEVAAREQRLADLERRPRGSG